MSDRDVISSGTEGPIKGIMWFNEKLADMAEAEPYAEKNIVQQVMELQLKFELDEIGEEEYDMKEKGLFARLDNLTDADGDEEG